MLLALLVEVVPLVLSLVTTRCRPAAARDSFARLAAVDQLGVRAVNPKVGKSASEMNTMSVYPSVCQPEGREV